jgi:type II secretory pathway component PulF
VIGGVVFWQWTRRDAGREWFDNMKLRIPLFGLLIRKATIARFARSLGALVHGGVPLMEALLVVNRVLNNKVLSASVDRIMERVRKGDSMARGMQKEPLFPEMVKYMIASGEDSGHLDDMLLKIADIYDMESRRTIKVLINLLAPLLILVVAGIVGFIAFAMLLPIFQINRMIQ